jgi:hypothetical protein
MRLCVQRPKHWFHNEEEERDAMKDDQWLGHLQRTGNTGRRRAEASLPPPEVREAREKIMTTQVAHGKQAIVLAGLALALFMTGLSPV